MLKYLASMYATIFTQTNGSQATNEQPWKMTSISTVSQNPSASDSNLSKHSNYPVRQCLSSAPVDHQQALLPPQTSHNSQSSAAGNALSLVKEPVTLLEANTPEQLISNVCDIFLQLKQKNNDLAKMELQSMEHTSYDKENLQNTRNQVKKIRDDLSSLIEKLPFEIESIYINKLHEIGINAYDSEGKGISLFKDSTQESDRKKINTEIAKINKDSISDIAELYSALRINHLNLRKEYTEFNKHNLTSKDRFINLEEMISDMHTLMEKGLARKLRIFDIAKISCRNPLAPESTQVNSNTKTLSKPNRDDSKVDYFSSSPKVW
ncbi:hypothetical protein [Mycoavidus sp. B2-EB]|uniref:hypothetical protein n=1 Tax=Mycoavidus sp. B2-EB TaxID=2651972 RepID=UPI0016277F05|nr:hypothetical protein [Mycoavidus sp. B2-EB]BBO60077.1 hypothetical protein MPB2EB_1215 [Mycoavidus sp. B2-EB]